MSEAQDVFSGWVDRVGDYRVERVLIPRPGNKPYYTMKPTGVCLLHTMESLMKWTPESFSQYRALLKAGRPDVAARRVLVYRVTEKPLFSGGRYWSGEEETKAMEAGINTLSMSRSAPHFSIGDHRIVQHRPLGVQAAALRGVHNARAYIQIELNATTEGWERTGQTWLPPDGTLEPLVAFLAFAFSNCGIPARVPNNWPDDMSDCPLPWAVEKNLRRRSPVWEQEQGVFMHLEVDNNNHFDCALMERSRIVQMALARTSITTSPPSPTLPASPNRPVLREGMKNDDVLAMQKALDARGYNLKADGQFGPNTKKALLLFQKDKGLKQDGICGPTTWAALTE